MVWGWFLGDLGTILEGSEASWKGLESLGGLLRGLGTPRSQDFEDVSNRLLDSGGPGTGRTMVYGNPVWFGPPKKPVLRTLGPKKPVLRD